MKTIRDVHDELVIRAERLAKKHFGINTYIMDTWSRYHSTCLLENWKGFDGLTTAQLNWIIDDLETRLGER